MIKDVVLHIGIHKTGTTFLQQACYRNRELLLANGLLYPDVAIFDGAQHKLAGSLNRGMCMAIFKPRHPPKFASIDEIPAWNELADALGAATVERALISTEEFEWLSDAGIVADFFRRRLPQAKVRVLVYLRRQDLYLESLYQQLVRDYPTRLKLTFQQWWKRQPDFVAFDGLVDRWEDAFGRGSVSVRLFEDEKTQGLTGGFLEAIGLGREFEKRLDIDPNNELVRDKSSMDARCIEFLRLANRVDVSPDRHRRLLSCLYGAHKALAAGEGGVSPHVLSGEERSRILERVERSNEALRARFFPHKQTLFPRLRSGEIAEPSLSIKEVVPELVQAGLF